MQTQQDLMMKPNSLFRRNDFRIGVAVCLVVVVGIIVWIVVDNIERGKRRELNSRWKFADQTFRQTQFENAWQSYEDIQSFCKAQDWAGSEQELAGLMQEIAQTCQKLEQAVEDQDSGEVADRLAVLKTLGESLRAQAPDENEQQVAEDLPSETEAYGPAYGRTERWEKVHSWLVSQAMQLITSLKREARRETGSISQDDLDVLDVLMTFDGEGEGSQSLKTQIGELRREIAYLKQTKAFKEALARALASLEENDLRAVLEAKEELFRDYPQRVDPALWTAYQEELQKTLIKKTRKITPDVAPAQGADKTALALPVLPLRNYTAFRLDRQIRRVDADEDKTLFARAEDLCFALSQEAGKPRWVCRVGYDARWLPQVADSFPSLVVLPWVHEGHDVITVAAADDLKLRWSETLPAGERFMGPPVLIDRSLYLLTNKGSVQQRDLLTGRVLQELILPEPPHSPLVLQEDQSGALVIGRTAGVYLIHLQGGLSLENVLLPDFGSEVLSYRGLWNPPFVLLFANHLTDVCLVSVFTQMGDTYRRVQTDDPMELAGRLRQTPAVFGPFCLVITDKGTETVLGLNDSNPLAPLYEVFRHDIPNVEVIQRPEFTSHPKGPFVTAVENRLQRYRINPLAKPGTQPRTIEWQHQLDDAQSVATQPLQILDEQVIFVTGSPAFQGRKVQSVDLFSGKLHWQVELGTPITEWYFDAGDSAPPRSMPVVARNQAGYVFRFSVDNGGWDDPVVTKTALNSTADWFPDESSPSIIFCETDPPRLIRNTMSGSTIYEEPLVSKVGSPVAVLEGDLHCREKQAKEPQKVPGAWVTFLDEGRQLHVKDTSALAQPPRRVLFAQLAGDIPNRGWNRPLWHRNQVVILSHPDGHLVRVEVVADGILRYTQETQKTRINRGIVGEPLLVEDQLWIAGKDGFCHVLDATSFKSQAKLALSAMPSTGVVKSDRFWIGLTNGRVAVLSDQPLPTLLTEREIAKTRIQYLVADACRKRVYVADNLLSLHEIDENLTIRQSVKLDTALSTAPLSTPSGLIVALTDGSVHRLWRWSPPSEGKMDQPESNTGKATIP